MVGIAKTYLEHPELQAALVAALTMLLLRALKKAGVAIYDGADWPNRAKAAIGAILLGLATSWVAHVASGEPVDWANLSVAVALAWVGSTGLHTLTRGRKGTTL